MMTAITALDGTTWPGPAYTQQQVQDRLALWREHLLEHKAGTSNRVLTLTHIHRELDRWLDERLDLRGR